MRIKTGNVTLLVGLAGLLAVSGSGSASAAVGLTKTEALRVATVALVKVGDVPKGFAAKASSAAEAAAEEEDEAAFYKCLGVAAPTFVVRKKGQKFAWADKETKQSLEIRSGADVTDTAEAAVDYQTEMRSVKAVGCFKQRLVNGFTRTEGVTVKSMQVDLLEATVAGADDAWAYRVKFVVTFKEADIVGHGYLVGTRVGEVLGAVGKTGQGIEVKFADVTALAAKPVARSKELRAQFAAKAKAKPATPANSGQPTKPAKPAKPAAPSEPETPGESKTPAKPAPAKPAPAQPAQPAAKPAPAKPAPEAEPVTPTEPTEPGRSGALTPPGGPFKP